MSTSVNRMSKAPSIAVIIPCYNEEQTIGKVISDFAKELPGARIIVGDNNSTDQTRARAEQSGAEVISVTRQGKGAVLRTFFREVDADIYVLVDGDDTYPADQVQELIAPVTAGRADMAVGDRIRGGDYARQNTRMFHGLGNALVVFLINTLFRTELRDILSGYRVFSRRFAKHCSILVDGFTVETEITLHAMDKLFSVVEVPIRYRDRPKGSSSKLSTFRDGFRVLRSILWIFKDNKPLIFFLILSGLFILSGLLGIFLQNSPESIWISTLLIVAGMIFITCGFVLDTQVKLQRENFEVQLIRDIESSRRNSK